MRDCPKCRARTTLGFQFVRLVMGTTVRCRACGSEFKRVPTMSGRLLGLLTIVCMVAGFHFFSTNGVEMIPIAVAGFVVIALLQNFFAISRLKD